MRIDKFFLIGFVIMLLLTFFMPQRIVMGDGASDILVIHFTPSGSVDGNVSPEKYDFSTVTWGANEESSRDFTVHNNGSVAMDAVGRQNTSTKEDGLICAGGGAPGADEYSIRITSGAGVDGNTNYINDVGNTVLDNDLEGSGSETFRLTIYLGSGSSNPGVQSTQINWTFSVATP